MELERLSSWATTTAVGRSGQSMQRAPTFARKRAKRSVVAVMMELVSVTLARIVQDPDHYVSVGRRRLGCGGWREKREILGDIGESSSLVSAQEHNIL